jgi:putative transposase
MLRDTTVIAFRQPDAIDDPLTALAREGGRRMLAQVLVAEADAFSGATADQLSFTLRATATRRSVSPLRNSAKSAAPI